MGSFRYRYEDDRYYAVNSDGSTVRVHEDSVRDIQRCGRRDYLVLSVPCSRYETLRRRVVFLYSTTIDPKMIKKWCDVPGVKLESHYWLINSADLRTELFEDSSIDPKWCRLVKKPDYSE